MHSPRVFDSLMSNVYLSIFNNLLSCTALIHKETAISKLTRNQKWKRDSPAHHRVSLQMHKCAAVIVQVLVRAQLCAFALQFIPACYFCAILSVKNGSATVVL